MNKKIILLIIPFTFLAGSIFYSGNAQITSGLFYDSKRADYQNDLLQDKDKADDDITISRRNIITQTVEKVSPAIVGINVTEIRQYRDPFSSYFDDPFFKQFFGNRGNYNQEVKNLGSGFIISPDGYIVTNDHVAGSGSKITITMTNGNHYDARIVGTDPVSDICLLKIDENNLPHVTLGNSDDIIIGEWVIALGNPFGLFEINDQPTVTVGVISAYGMNLEPLDGRYYLKMIQTDASINGGNSGGALVNSIGEVIGMNTLIFTAGSQGSIGLGFAIPINKVKNIITELKERGVINRDFYIGMRIQGIDEGIAKYYNLKDTKGVIVTQVMRNSPASRAGIEAGDIIIQVDGFKINNENIIQGVFQEFRRDQNINIKLLREGKELTLNMKLEKN